MPYSVLERWMSSFIVSAANARFVLRPLRYQQRSASLSTSAHRSIQTLYHIIIMLEEWGTPVYIGTDLHKANDDVSQGSHMHSQGTRNHDDNRDRVI